MNKCLWCGSDNCDTITLCDLCYEDISDKPPIYLKLPDHIDADDEGIIRVCYNCYKESIE